VGLAMKLEKPEVGIIGGTSGMGAWFADLLEHAGLKVFRVGRRTDITPAEMARQCGVTVISVPIADTMRVIQEIGPLVPENGLLMDLTSIKAEPIKAMLRYSSVEVVGMHPLFGPDSSARNLNLRVIVCPGRGKQGLGWLRKILRQAGLAVTTLSAEEHDRIMGLVQGVNHFTTLALALCVIRSRIGIEDLLKCSTQTFSQRLDRITSVLGQPSGLFGSLLMENPSAGAFIEQYLNAAEEVANVISGKDWEGFEKMFEALNRFFIQDMGNEKEIM